MIPVKLSLSGFLSYRDPVEVDFTGFNLACISGPNGAGKSSLLDGITWALFGKARKTDDSIINTNSNQAEIEFTFIYEKTTYRIQRVKPRGKTTVLEFHIQSEDGKWKPLTDRTMRGTEALITKTLNLDYETFINASFFLQGKADQFTQQTAAKRKAILGSILGLEVWESYRQTSASQRRKVEQDISSQDGKIEEINSELAEGDERKKQLAENEAKLKQSSESRAAQQKLLEGIRAQAAALAEQDKLVETLITQLEKGRLSLSEQEERLSSRQDEKTGFDTIMGLEKEIIHAHKELLTTRKELADWVETQANFQEQDKRRNGPLTEIEKARTRLESERDNLLKEEGNLKSNQLTPSEQDKQIEEYNTVLEHISTEVKERDRLESQRQEVMQTKAGAEAENPLLKTEMDDLKDRITKLESSNGSVCPTCGQPLTPDERKRLITELKADGKVKGDTFRENKDNLKATKTQLTALKKDLKSFAKVDDRHREHIRQIDQFTSQIEQLAGQNEAWKKENAPRLKNIQAQLKKDDFALESRSTLAEIDAELIKIGYDAPSHDAVKKKVEELGQAELDLRELEKAQAALAPLEREIGELTKQIKNDKGNIAGQKKTHQEAADALDKAQQDAPNLAQAEDNLRGLQEQENKIRMEVGAAQQKVSVLKDLKKRRKELEGKREELAQQVNQHKTLERAFGKDGVPAMLIEQALPQIEAKANEILERLSGGTMSVRFLTQQEYKTKRDDLKETLEIQISDTTGTRDYEMFSGGESFRINFAIRLALSEVLAQRAGARLQTLVIDEGFGSQDEAGRQRLIEAINLVKDDFAKILVITHIDSLKDAFPTRIEVEKTPRGSIVSVN